MIDPARTAAALEAFEALALLDAVERRSVLSLLDDRAPFVAELARAATIHVHLRVDDVAELPHARIRAAGGSVENERDGYVKYAFDGGVNVILSSIDVAEDDRLPTKQGRPHLDHVGIDLRDETPEVRALFDAAPAKARALGWRHVAQGGEGRDVFCCHTSVAEKHWLYPTSGELTRPIELAYGRLEIHAGTMGCDLRPIDPAHPMAAKSACCAAAPELVGGSLRKPSSP